jgi:hypothetical protein
MNHELCINATDGSGLGSRNSRISAMTRSRPVRCQPETLLDSRMMKRLVKIPSTWGAKISGEQFRERAKEYLSN